MSQYWQHVLSSVWGIDAAISSLDGEYDLNFLATGQQDYVLKVMRQGCEPAFIDLQCKAFDHIINKAPTTPVPAVVRTLGGERFTEVADASGEPRIIWLLEKVEGLLFAHFKPHSPALIHDIGSVLGTVDKALSDFEHPELHRGFKWDLSQADWIKDHLGVLANSNRRSLVSSILSEFEAIKAALTVLPYTAIHNDANDYNLIVSGSLISPAHVTGLIDLGDICACPRICDLAIAAAYIVLDNPAPEAALASLVAGYHQQYPLTPQELDLLWPLLRMRLAVSVVNSTMMAVENPDDPYVVISQKPAWEFLESDDVDTGLISARLRAACGLPVTDAAPRILAWLDQARGSFAHIMGEDLSTAPLGSLSVEDTVIPQNPFEMSLSEAATVGHQYDNNSKIWLGYYHEPRLVYTATAFRNGPWKASDRRTVHLAIDAFAPAGTTIYAPMDATVEAAEYRAGHLDYGGVVILRHHTPEGDAFFTLYGHLNPEICDNLKVGQRLVKSEAFAKLGDITQSGGWAPHTHIQLAVTTAGMGDDWPGVASPDEMYLWGKVFPNPATLLNLHDEKICYQSTNKAQVLESRKTHFGSNLKLSYSDPIMLLRGWKHHLFDEWGRPYLDAYNNVPHVGHAHPRIQAVAADQLQRMNSNTRYLHPAQTAFAEKLLSKLPASLSVCYFVNSGSEANELALRLARAYSDGKDTITPDHGYHGNTTGAIDISAYKFNAKGGVGPSDWVHLIDVADDYRGRYKRDDPERAEKYAAQVDNALTKIARRGGKLAGFIAETFPSVGGQIIPPTGYLSAVYERIRAAGGVCIADEVQTGLGRLGHYYFGFEQQQVTPDIVVLGKPIGNGHPIGVVVTTKAIAERFAEGPEYFSTFGGSTLSCKIGKEVLDIVDDEGLMDNARLMGDTLLEGLRALQNKHEVIGDVRGFGLFIGVELIENQQSKKPAADIANYVINRMREHRILLGSEGPYNNILKVRPPLTIGPDDIEMILAVLDEVLDEATTISN